MKRRTQSARAVRAAASAAVTLETLELRRMLSASPELPFITDTDGGYGYATFGQSVATQGNLALIGSPGLTTAIIPDGENYEPIDTTNGRVSLVDTTTGTVLHTFHNPISNPNENSQFGASVAFVDGKIAIGAPGEVSVFIYNVASDWNAPNADVPTLTYTYGSDPSVGYGGSMAVVGDDLLVSVRQGAPITNNGAILRYDLDSSAPGEADTYINLAPGTPNENDQFGAVMAGDATHIYATANVNGEREVVVMDLAGNLLNTYPSVVAGDFLFGMAMTTYHDASVGDTVIISSPFDSTAVQYDIEGEGDPIQTFVMPVSVEGFAGGATSLTVSGSKLIVGDVGKVTIDPDDESATIPTGGAYVFDLASGDYEATIENPNQGSFFNQNLSDSWDNFGAQVAALPGGGFLVSAPYANNTNGIDAGTVYTYAPDDGGGEENVAPVAGAITLDGAAVRLLETKFVASASDDNDTDALQVAWDFGDGATLGFADVTDPSDISASHVYASTGTFTVTMTVKDAELTSSSTLSVTVTAAGVQGGVLYVGGSGGNNAVSVSQSGSNVLVTVDGVTTTYVGPRVVIYGGDGDDAISVSGNVNAAIEAYGGAGNDSLQGGNANDILVGGDGDDLLQGKDGRDILIGGSGADRLVGQQDDDILIAGYTVHDSDPATLEGIMEQWSSSGTYEARVAAVRGGLLVTDDVSDDGAVDVLTGSQGQDWFIFNVDIGVKDKVTDLKAIEFASDIDFLTT